MYLKIKAEGWPTDRYRLECYNCNFARAHHEKCPHEQKYMDAQNHAAKKTL